MSACVFVEKFQTARKLSLSQGCIALLFLIPFERVSSSVGRLVSLSVSYNFLKKVSINIIIYMQFEGTFWLVWKTRYGTVNKLIKEQLL